MWSEGISRQLWYLLGLGWENLEGLWGIKWSQHTLSTISKGFFTHKVGTFLLEPVLSHSCIHGTNIECLCAFLSSILDPGDIALNWPGEDPCFHEAYIVVGYMLPNIILRSSSCWLSVSCRCLQEKEYGGRRTLVLTYWSISNIIHDKANYPASS